MPLLCGVCFGGASETLLFACVSVLCRRTCEHTYSVVRSSLGVLSCQLLLSGIFPLLPRCVLLSTGSSTSAVFRNARTHSARSMLMMKSQHIGYNTCLSYAFRRTSCSSSTFVTTGARNSERASVRNNTLHGSKGNVFPLSALNPEFVSFRKISSNDP